MPLDAILPALAAGAIIGAVLAMFGAGGSILAVPLLIYFVGISSTHSAIGTAAVAVALSAFASLIGHTRAGNVKWPCAIGFAGFGIIGAALGAELGKTIDGSRLLLLFGIVMIVVGVSMWRSRPQSGNPEVQMTRANALPMLAKVLPIGLVVGFAAGLFGIGGGFLIVPGLILATRMPMINAAATSLVVISALGLTTATSYAFSGYVNWQITGLMVAGGIAGAALGLPIGRRLSTRRGLMRKVFGTMVIALGASLSIGSA
ncbi:MAG: sulfite exporter TauE/SafE family protein [Erythrobacter sp.]